MSEEPPEWNEPIYDSSDSELEEGVGKSIPQSISRETSTEPIDAVGTRQTTVRPRWLFGVGNAVRGTLSAVSSLVFGPGPSEHVQVVTTDPYASPLDVNYPHSAGYYVDDGNGTNQPFAVEDAPSLGIDLLTAIRQYLRFSSDAMFSLVRSALTARNLDTNPVTPEEFREGAADQSLVKLMIESFKLNYDNPAIQQELNQCIAIVVLPNPAYAGRVAPDIYDFLSVLVSVRCARITVAQRDLLLESGFEFVEMIKKNPHVTKGIPSADICSLECLACISEAIEPFLLITGILIIYFDIFSLLYCIQYWYSRAIIHFNISLLVWLGGHVLSFIAARIVIATREDESVYGEGMSDFPSIYLKVLPVIPLFETANFLAGMKHQCRHTSYALQHDLGAIFTLMRVIHALFISTPQILLQSYYFVFDKEIDHLGYQLFTVSALISIFGSLPLYLRNVISGHSCNTLGFTFFGKRMPTGGQEYVSKFARVLALLLLYLLEFNCFLLIIAALNLKTCSTFMIFWICLSGVTVLFTLLMFVVTLRTTKNIFKASKWLILPIVLQLAFTVFFAINKNNDEKAGCRLFFALQGVISIVSYVGWGLTGIVGLTWVVNKLWKSYKEDREAGASPAEEAAVVVRTTTSSPVLNEGE